MAPEVAHSLRGLEPCVYIGDGFPGSNPQNESIPVIKA